MSKGNTNWGKAIFWLLIVLFVPLPIILTVGGIFAVIGIPLVAIGLGYCIYVLFFQTSVGAKLDTKDWDENFDDFELIYNYNLWLKSDKTDAVRNIKGMESVIKDRKNKKLKKLKDILSDAEYNKLNNKMPLNELSVIELANDVEMLNKLSYEDLEILLDNMNLYANLRSYKNEAQVFIDRINILFNIEIVNNEINSLKKWIVKSVKDNKEASGEYLIGEVLKRISRSLKEYLNKENYMVFLKELECFIVEEIIENKEIDKLIKKYYVEETDESFFKPIIVNKKFIYNKVFNKNNYYESCMDITRDEKVEMVSNIYGKVVCKENMLRNERKMELDNKNCESIKGKQTQTIVQQLKEFKELLDSNIITQEEFDKKKLELLK